MPRPKDRGGPFSDQDYADAARTTKGFMLNETTRICRVNGKLCFVRERPNNKPEPALTLYADLTKDTVKNLVGIKPKETPKKLEEEKAIIQASTAKASQELETIYEPFGFDPCAQLATMFGPPSGQSSQTVTGPFGSTGPQPGIYRRGNRELALVPIVPQNHHMAPIPPQGPYMTNTQPPCPHYYPPCPPWMYPQGPYVGGYIEQPTDNDAIRSHAQLWKPMEKQAITPAAKPASVTERTETQSPAPPTKPASAKPTANSAAVSETSVTISKHVCGKCGNVRSAKYHYHNPIKPGEVPSISFCGKCQKEETSTERSRSRDRGPKKSTKKSKKHRKVSLV